MDIATGTAVAKTAVDMVKNENVLNKTASVMGMLFPFAGIRQKAVEVYLEDIEKSDLPPETKVFMILNTKKTFKKIKNQKSIAEIAMANAKEGTDFSEKSGVDEEWLDRFMDSAGFVSSEEVQLIWGKILANEFEKPGSTPPNMIRVLSEITPSLAKAFRYICSMSVRILPLSEDGNIIEENVMKVLFVPYRGNDELFRNKGISFDILNELETLGVIKIEAIGGYITKGIKNKKVLIFAGDKLELINKHKDDQVPIGNVLLTSVGKALSSITENVEIDGYHEMIKKYLNNEGNKLAEEHDFVAQIVGDTVKIEKKTSGNVSG